MAQGTPLSVMWQPGWEGSFGENGHICMYGWVPSLFSWNYHNIVNWLYPIQNKKLKKKKKAPFEPSVSWNAWLFVGIQNPNGVNFHRRDGEIAYFPLSSTFIFSMTPGDLLNFVQLNSQWQTWFLESWKQGVLTLLTRELRWLLRHR